MKGLWLATVALALACRGQEHDVRSDSAPGTAPGVPAAVNPGASVAESATRVSCPATGLWSQCAVFERLDRAGLAPQRDSAAPTEPPLTAPGARLRIGRSELELYVYPDIAAREREEATLQRDTYLAGDAPIGMQSQPTLIRSANLLVILHSRNDHQRERVFDAITAGPPQPAKP